MILLFWKLQLAEASDLPKSKANCLRQHVQDAITLNQLRKPLYAQLTNGRSIFISEQLIAFEKSMIISSWLADWWATRFQKLGIPILCDDLVDMKLTPPFSTDLPYAKVPLEKDFVDFDAKALQKKLTNALDSNLSSLAESSKKYLVELQNEPRLNCMIRHFLESIYVFSVHGKTYVQKINSLQKNNLRLFLRRLLKSHISYLKTAIVLDKMGLPLQVEGVPILCQDLPPYILSL
ncbi:MAG: hypothetical protein AABY64_06725 [Bdellovibrionota bacterium]